MGFTDLLRADHIFLDLHPKDVRDCLEIMAGQIAARGVLTDPADAVTRLLDRESTMSTGMGGGVAVPHAKSPMLREMVVALGQVPEGVDFKAIDGRPVYLVFLLMGPPDSTRQHVDLLARIAYLVKLPGMVETLRGATTADQVLAAIRSEPARDRR